MFARIVKTSSSSVPTIPEHALSADTTRLSIGEMLKLARELKGLTGTELAKQSGVSRTFISKLENGYSNVSIETIESIANALGYSVVIGLESSNA